MKCITSRFAILTAAMALSAAHPCLAQESTLVAPEAPAKAPGPVKQASSAQAEAGEPRAATSESRKGKNAADRVDLDTTTVTGNRELPKVMYVVPWKRSDIGDLIGRPANSLLDEVLAPVDRNVFRREVQYYRALKPDAAPAVPQVEK